MVLDLSTLLPSGVSCGPQYCVGFNKLLKSLVLTISMIAKTTNGTNVAVPINHPRVRNIIKIFINNKI